MLIYTAQETIVACYQMFVYHSFEAILLSGGVKTILIT